MICPRCSKENENNAERCAECGSPLQRSAGREREGQSQSHPGTKVPIWAYVSAVAVIMVALLVGLGQHSESSSSQTPNAQTPAPNLEGSQAPPSQNTTNETRTQPGTSRWVSSVVMSATGELFAGTDSALFLSKDLGSTWQAVPLKDSRGHALKEKGLVYVHDSGKNNLFGSYMNLTPSSNGVDVYFLCDDGKSWHPIVPPQNIDVEYLSSVSASRSSIYAIAISERNKTGVYHSTDTGETWSFAGLGGRNIQELQVSPQGILFARVQVNSVADYSLSHPRPADERNLYRSTHGGANWRLLSLEAVSSLAFTGKRTAVAFNASRSHVTSSGEITSYHYLSSDDGNYWREVSDRTFTTGWGTAVCTDGTILQVGWGTTDYSNNDPSETWLLARSGDGGCTWTSTGISGTSTSAGGSIGGSYLWTGAKGYALFVPPVSGANFYISSDNGQSWQLKTVR